MNLSTKKMRNIALGVATIVVAAFFLVVVPMQTFGFVVGASYFGTLAGATVGFGALIAGHLFNSHLNRMRDRELRITQSADCATAVLAEVMRNRDALRSLDQYLDSENPHESGAIEDFGSQLSCQVFDDNIVGFCAGIVAANCDDELQRILLFYASVRLMHTSLVKASTHGREILLPDDTAMLKQACFSGGNQVATTLADIQRLREILRTLL
jgi:hypothetical protein